MITEAPRKGDFGRQVHDYARAERVNRRCGYHVRAALGVAEDILATQKGR